MKTTTADMMAALHDAIERSDNLEALKVRASAWRARRGVRKLVDLTEEGRRDYIAACGQEFR